MEFEVDSNDVYFAYALYSVLINTLEAKIAYYGSRLLFKFHY